MRHPDFVTMVNKHTNSKDAKELLRTAEMLEQKGLGEMPSDTPSAKGARRSGTFNRGSRQGSADSVDSQSSM